MDEPTMFEPYRAAPDIDVIPSYFPIPGYGILPINAFVLHAAEPVLVDTGLVLLSGEFLPRLVSVIDPEDIRWLWLTHPDPDHTGSLYRLVDEFPRLRVITTFLGLGRLSLTRPLPLDRVYLLNPGQSLDVGDRTLTAVKPATFDAPETTGFCDSGSGAFFSADSFGALMSELVEDAAEIPPDDLRQGMITWTAADSPWLHSIDPAKFTNTLNRIRDRSPTAILSSHLPPAHGMIDPLLENLAAVPTSEPFVGPDQPALAAMLGHAPAR